MKLEEIREIREKQSLETIGMTIDELNAYFGKGAEAMEKLIDKHRKDNAKLDTRPHKKGE